MYSIESGDVETLSVLLTFDQDWAPTWLVKTTLDVFNISEGVFFITDNADSELISYLNQRGLQIGIHPNFDQCFDKSMVATRVRDLLKLAPYSNSFRAHRLHTSNLINEYISCEFPQLQNDFSHLTYGLESSVSPHPTKYGQMKKFVMSWEDDVALKDELSPNFLKICKNFRLSIFDFHPIHLYLNTSNLESYELMKEAVNLPNASESEILNFVNKSNFGVGDFLRNIQHDLPNNKPWEPI